MDSRSLSELKGTKFEHITGLHQLSNVSDLYKFISTVSYDCYLRFFLNWDIKQTNPNLIPQILIYCITYGQDYNSDIQKKLKECEFDEIRMTKDEFCNLHQCVSQ